MTTLLTNRCKGLCLAGKRQKKIEILFGSRQKCCQTANAQTRRQPPVSKKTVSFRAMCLRACMMAVSPADGEGMLGLVPAVTRKEVHCCWHCWLHCTAIVCWRPCRDWRPKRYSLENPCYLKRCNLPDSRRAHLQLGDCGFGIHTRSAQLIDQLLAARQQLHEVLVVCKLGTSSLAASLSCSCL